MMLASAGEGALRPTWRGVLHKYSLLLLPVPLYFLVREADSTTVGSRPTSLHARFCVESDPTLE